MPRAKYSRTATRCRGVGRAKYSNRRRREALGVNQIGLETLLQQPIIGPVYRRRRQYNHEADTTERASSMPHPRDPQPQSSIDKDRCITSIMHIDYIPR